MNDPIPTGASIRENTATNDLIAILAVVLTIAAIIWAADVPRTFGLLLYTEQFLAGMLAIAVPLVFLTQRAKKQNKSAGQKTVPWYDFIFA